ncbi:hypothetical protein G6F60_014623 [Rhizopus arrhizus]|nr:hypothetical protein G6F60_014623 [Rhizopus arrhizus]
MAYHLLEREREGGQRLAETLALAVERIGHCAQCRDFSETELCPTCANSSRERSQLCVVESPADRLAIENATGFPAGEPPGRRRGAGVDHRHQRDRRGRGHRALPGAAGARAEGAAQPPGARAAARRRA